MPTACSSRASTDRGAAVVVSESSTDAPIGRVASWLESLFGTVEIAAAAWSRAGRLPTRARGKQRPPAVSEIARTAGFARKLLLSFTHPGETTHSNSPILVYRRRDAQLPIVPSICSTPRKEKLMRTIIPRLRRPA